MAEAMDLQELNVYQRSMDIADRVWMLVAVWPYFAQDTIGKQLVRAVDSIGANISEGYGGYHYKENQRFCYYSRGSLKETETWLRKAYRREILSESDFLSLMKELEITAKMLNRYIQSIGRNSKSTR